MRCDIIVPVWNQLEATRDCVDSILKTTGVPYRLIIIDNASDSRTSEYLNGLRAARGKDIALIRNEKNLGFVKAVNQGIRASDAPYVCVMNNDTVAASGWLEEMIRIAKAHPEIGLVNPSSNTSGQFPKAGESIESYAAGIFAKSGGQTQELYRCRGFCMLMKREVIGRIGLLDESYSVGYFDDTDYSRRAALAGFRAARAKGAYVWHRENVSFGTLKDNRELFRKNEEAFFGRWGRPVRVGYFIDRAGSPEAIDNIAVSAARSGHPVFIFLKKGLKWPVKVDHFDIRRFDVNGAFFGFASICKIFKRKKKKKLEVLLTDNALFGSFLRATRFLHGSDVIIRPRPEELMGLLREKSRHF